MAISFSCGNALQLYKFLQKVDNICKSQEILHVVCDDGSVYFVIDRGDYVFSFTSDTLTSCVVINYVFRLSDFISALKHFKKEFDFDDNNGVFKIIAPSIGYSYIDGKIDNYQYSIPVDDYLPVNGNAVSSLSKLYFKSEFSGLWNDFAYLYLHSDGNMNIAFTLPNICASFMIGEFPINISAKIDINILKLLSSDKLFVGAKNNYICFRSFRAKSIITVYCNIKDHSSLGCRFFDSFKVDNGGPLTNKQICAILDSEWGEKIAITMRKNEPCLRIKDLDHVLKIDGKRLVGSGSIVIHSFKLVTALQLFDSCNLLFNSKYLWLNDKNNIVVISGINEEL